MDCGSREDEKGMNTAPQVVAYSRVRLLTLVLPRRQLRSERASERARPFISPHLILLALPGGSSRRDGRPGGWARYHA